MQIVLKVLEMVLPVFVMITIGFILGRRNLVKPEGITGVKTLVSNVMLPIVLFNALANARYSLSTAIIFLVVIGANAVTLAVGFLTRGWMGKYGRFSPFLMAGGEIGMLGYALFALLAGSGNLFYLASVDLGNILFCFTIYLALLLVAAGGKPNARDMVSNILHSPCFIGALLGLIVGVTGLGGILFSSLAGPVVSAVITLVTAPTSALILIVVGYDFMPDKAVIRPVLKSMAMRMIVFGLSLGLGMLLLFRIVPYEKTQMFALILYWALPAPLFVPIYTNSEEQGKFVSTALSLYMVVTLLVFTVMAAFTVA